MNSFKALIRAMFYKLPVPGTVYVLNNEPYHNVRGHNATVMRVEQGTVHLQCQEPFEGVYYSMTRAEFHLLYKLYKGIQA